MAAVMHRQQNDDGTVTVYYDDGTSASYGTPRDPVETARRSGQAAAAQTSAMYGDPWYQENVLGPMNQQAAAQAQEQALALKQKAQQLALRGRQVEASIANQRADIELRKAQLRQQGILQAAGMLANARGAGNAAQRIDLGRRLGGFGAQSSALAQIAAGGVPTGAFSMRTGDRPTSEADYLSGMLGAGQSQLNQRDANDRGLARQIGSSATRLARGSIEALSPYEKSYLGSYLDAEGFDADQFSDEYARAGIMQGR